MKFSLVLLLGLCAFASSSDIFEDIPDVEYIHLEPIIVPRFGDITIPTAINEYMAKVSAEFNEIVKKFKDISGTVRNEVATNNDEQMTEVNKKVIILRQDIQELVKKGPSYAACGSQHLSEINDISGAVAVGIKECAGDIASALKVLADDIVAASTAIVGDSLRLKDIVLECYNQGSKFGAAKCVLQHVVEFKALASKVMGIAKESLKNFKEHGLQLVESVKKCNEQHIQTTYTKLQNIKNVLVECAK